MTEASRLEDELSAILAGLVHARHQLTDGDITNVAGLSRRLDACARRVGALERRPREAVRPLMLALLDELERTIAAFHLEHEDLGARLRSTSRSLAADAAYRQASPG